MPGYVLDTSAHSYLACRADRIDPEWRKAAARLKARAGLSLGDAWNASLALLLDAELVHKDPEFDDVKGLKSLRLPYKPKTR